VRPATQADAASVADLWELAGGWLANRGSDQWQYPPDQLKIRTDIEAGNVFVVVRDFIRDAEPPLATITLDTSADPEFWESQDAPDTALYVHRTIVHPGMKGYQVGSALLDWASLRAAAAGQPWLRLDAWRTNTSLHDYYRREGFSHVRTVNLPHRRSGALFQRRAGHQSFRGPLLHDVQHPMYDTNGCHESEWGRAS
jgi:ribosomal protein S18 acetylase RimI-like enzyme